MRSPNLHEGDSVWGCHPRGECGEYAPGHHRLGISFLILPRNEPIRIHRSRMNANRLTGYFLSWDKDEIAPLVLGHLDRLRIDEYIVLAKN